MRTILLVLIFVTSTCYSQEFYNWESTELPGSIYDFVVIDSTTFICKGYFEGHAFFKTTDGGESFSAITSIPNTGITWMFKLGERLFFRYEEPAGNYKLGYSDDLGNSFTLSGVDSTSYVDNMFLLENRIALRYYNSREIYVSNDNGDTWELLCEPSYLFLDISETATDTLFATGTWDVVWRSVNGGTDWTTVQIDDFRPDSYIVSDNRIFIKGESHFGISTDNGDSWQLYDRNLKNSVFLKDFSDNIYLSKRLDNELSDKLQLFRIELNPLRLVQILTLSKEFNSFPQIYIQDRVYYNQHINLYSQGESISVANGTNFFPLNENNEWLFWNSKYNPENNTHISSIQHRTTRLDTVIAGKQFYSFSDQPDVKYYFEESTNSVFVLNDSGQTELLYNFNLHDDYFTYPENTYSGRRDYLFDINPIPSYFEDRVEIVLHQFPKIEDGTYPRSRFVEGIGFATYNNMNWDADTLMGLTQSKTFDPLTNEFDIVDRMLDPEIIFTSDMFELTGDTLELECRVKHAHAILTMDSTFHNTVDSVIFEYYFDDGVDEPDIITVPLSYRGFNSLEMIYDLYLEFGIPENEINVKYRIKAITKGIIPHTVYEPAEGWNELFYGTTSNSRVPRITDYSLSANYPNPFNPSTKMEFTLPKESDVMISVYNVTGEELFTATAGNYKAGRHEVTINMSDYSSGVYFVRMIAGEKNFTQKIMLLK